MGFGVFSGILIAICSLFFPNLYNIGYADYVTTPDADRAFMIAVIETCMLLHNSDYLPEDFDLDNIASFALIKESVGDLFYTNATAYGKFYCTAINAQTSLHKPVIQPGGYGVWMDAFGTESGNRFVQTLIYNVTGSASNRNQIYKRFYSSGGWSNWFIVGMTEIIP